MTTNDETWARRKLAELLRKLFRLAGRGEKL